MLARQFSLNSEQLAPSTNLPKSEHNRVPKEVRKIRILEATEASTRAPVCINTARVEKPPERAKIAKVRASTRAPVCINTARVDGPA